MSDENTIKDLRERLDNMTDAAESSLRREAEVKDRLASIYDLLKGHDNYGSGDASVCAREILTALSEARTERDDYRAERDAAAQRAKGWREAAVACEEPLKAARAEVERLQEEVGALRSRASAATLRGQAAASAQAEVERLRGLLREVHSAWLFDANQGDGIMEEHAEIEARARAALTPSDGQAEAEVVDDTCDSCGERCGGDCGGSDEPEPGVALVDHPENESITHASCDKRHPCAHRPDLWPKYWWGPEGQQERLREVAEAILETVGEDGGLSRLSEHSILDVRDLAVAALTPKGGEGEDDLVRSELRKIEGLVSAEVERILARWGVRDHPLTWPGNSYPLRSEKFMKLVVSVRAKDGTLAWADILLEEWVEATEAATAEDRVAELVQVAAVAITAAECVKRASQTGGEG